MADADLNAEDDDEAEPEDEAPDAVHEADDEPDDEADDLDAPDGHDEDTGEIQDLDLEDMADPDDGLREIITEPGWYLPGGDGRDPRQPGRSLREPDRPGRHSSCPAGCWPTSRIRWPEPPRHTAGTTSDSRHRQMGLRRGRAGAEPGRVELARTWPTKEGAAAAAVGGTRSPSGSAQPLRRPVRASPARGGASRRTASSSAPPRQRSASGGKRPVTPDRPLALGSARGGVMVAVARAPHRVDRPHRAPSPWRPGSPRARSPTATAPCRGKLSLKVELRRRENWFRHGRLTTGTA